MNVCKVYTKNYTLNKSKVWCVSSCTYTLHSNNKICIYWEQPSKHKSNDGDDSPFCNWTFVCSDSHLHVSFHDRQSMCENITFIIWSNVICDTLSFILQNVCCFSTVNLKAWSIQSATIQQKYIYYLKSNLYVPWILLKIYLLINKMTKWKKMCWKKKVCQ